jgi:putative endonuclease
MIAAEVLDVATMFSRRSAAKTDRQQRGDAADAPALEHLSQQGLVLVERNYRVARGPRLRGGEVDLILRARRTLVFVEVRARADARHGGAAARIGAAKRASMMLAARHCLLRSAKPPPCRFDVLAIDAGAVQWLRGAFDATQRIVEPRPQGRVI